MFGRKKLPRKNKEGKIISQESNESRQVKTEELRNGRVKAKTEEWKEDIKRGQEKKLKKGINL